MNGCAGGIAAVDGIALGAGGVGYAGGTEIVVGGTGGTEMVVGGTGCAGIGGVTNVGATSYVGGVAGTVSTGGVNDNGTYGESLGAASADA